MVRIRKVKKTEMFFFVVVFFFPPRVCVQKSAKTTSMFSCPSVCLQMLFFFSTAEMEVESQTVQRHISVIEGKSVFPRSVSLKGCFTFKPFSWADFTISTQVQAVFKFNDCFVFPSDLIVWKM